MSPLVPPRRVALSLVALPGLVAIGHGLLVATGVEKFAFVPLAVGGVVAIALGVLALGRPMLPPPALARVAAPALALPGLMLVALAPSPGLFVLALAGTMLVGLAPDRLARPEGWWRPSMTTPRPKTLAGAVMPTVFVGVMVGLLVVAAALLAVSDQDLAVSVMVHALAGAGLGALHHAMTRSRVDVEIVRAGIVVARRAQARSD